jgi:hypothetical protein
MTVSAIGVIGGGAWGTALAQVAAAGGRETLLWAREPEVVESVNSRHENSIFLPGLPLDPAFAPPTISPAWPIATPCSSSRRPSIPGQCFPRPRSAKSRSSSAPRAWRKPPPS